MSSLTSLSVNKGSTRFAPKVKARPRRPAQQQDQQQGESSADKSAQPEEPQRAEEPAAVVPESTPAHLLQVPSHAESVPHEDLSPLETLAAVASSASREGEPPTQAVAPAEASSGKKLAEKGEKSSTKRKIRTSKKSSAKAIPISTPIAIATPGQSSTEHTREASTEADKENADDDGSVKRRGLKRDKDYDPEELKTLDDIDYDPAPKDYLDRPMSHFIRDLQTGVVSKTFKEYEIDRVNKKKRMEEQSKMSEHDREAAQLADRLEEQARRIEEERRKKEAEERRERELDENPVLQETSHAPQVRLINGQIVLDIDSLTVERQDETQELDTSMMEVVEESTMSRIVNSRTYSRYVQSARWRAPETEKFYEAISMFGTDFEMISHVMPGRTRNQIRLKFNKEERTHPEKIKEYLIRKRKPINLEELKDLTGKEFDEVPDSFSEPLTFAD
ncbi:hypothetical protein BJV82DRAFT_616571 [Fennellomyces sp. T-0311]|nr:hypothetical protein BJV82DRAFT_616571 [Fennellomyces sp. T-0311]